MTARIAVCVPVRDEALRIPRLLRALSAQAGPSITLCLLFDGCTDSSAAIAAHHATALRLSIVTASAPRAEPNAGRARRAAMALGAALVGTDGILLCTDADSTPAADWVAANVAALARADVVAGRVVRGGSAIPIQDRLEAYYDALFALRRRLDPVPWEAANTHHCASGASLGFHASAYALLGGFDPVPAGEDGRIVDAAHRAGLRVRRDADVTVRTSARRHGRAAGGLADHLSHLDRSRATPVVAHPEDCAWRYAMQARARAAFHADRTALARALLPMAIDVEAIASRSPNPEAFATQVVPPVAGGERMVSLCVAEQALVRLRDEPERAAA